MTAPSEQSFGRETCLSLPSGRDIWPPGLLAAGMEPLKQLVAVVDGKM